MAALSSCSSDEAIPQPKLPIEELAALDLFADHSDRINDIRIAMLNVQASDEPEQYAKIRDFLISGKSHEQILSEHRAEFFPSTVAYLEAKVQYYQADNALWSAVDRSMYTTDELMAAHEIYVTKYKQSQESDIRAAERRLLNLDTQVQK